MKALKIIIVTTCLLCTGTGLALARGNGAGNTHFKGPRNSSNGPSIVVSQLPYEELNQAERDGLLKMREEEKLARDVYTYLYDLWQNPVFSRISQAEQRHMDAVGALLAKYGLTDPVDGMGHGQFNSQEMQELYYDLTSKGTATQEDAFLVGAAIEDLDIKDLGELLSTTDNEDIQTVYQNLVKGSRNHMRAFGSRLANLDTTYQAQFLTQEEIDAILNSPWERGHVDKDGNLVSSPCHQGSTCRGKGSGCSGNGGHARNGANFTDMDGDGICDHMTGL